MADPACSSSTLNSLLSIFVVEDGNLTIKGEDIPVEGYPIITEFINLLDNQSLTIEDVGELALQQIEGECKLVISGKIPAGLNIPNDLNISLETITLTFTETAETDEVIISLSVGDDIPVDLHFDTDSEGSLVTRLGGEEGLTLLQLNGIINIGVALPDAFDTLSLFNFTIPYQFTESDFLFSCEVGTEDLRFVFSINRSPTGEISFKISITFDDDPVYEFEVSTGNAGEILACWQNEGDGFSINIKDFITSFSTGTSVVLDYLPDLNVDLKRAFFAIGNVPDPNFPGDPTKLIKGYLFSIPLSANISLSNLPLVGAELPDADMLSIDDLQFSLGSVGFSKPDLSGFKNIFPTDFPKPDLDRDFPSSVSLSALLNFGGIKEWLQLPIPDGGSGDLPEPAGTADDSDEPTISFEENTLWYNLQKSFGPVYFEKVGIQYEDNNLNFLLNAALKTKSLTISVDGLSLGSRIDSFSPRFDIRGIGINYEDPNMEISGAFLKSEDQEGNNIYSGTALFKTDDLSLSALGSYATTGGDPSLFIYALLDRDIGGPAYFYVTGLAAGFGYNRYLNVPSLEEIEDFPLVQMALNSQSAMSLDDLEATVQSLNHYLPPSSGDLFVAIGVKFTTFKLIESFALLTANFSDPFELNILGMSTLIAPKPEDVNDAPVTPLVQVKLAFQAAYVPDEGSLQISGQLTPDSYILSRDCQLTGGFALFSWFTGEHAGDFVISLGGYHPDFDKPPHYPNVPRLGYNWQLTNALSIKGQAYYALTPALMMAGGSLEATWKEGDIEVSFRTGADFLVYYKPYYYDAQMHLDLDASYTLDMGFYKQKISVNVGANLHIWGPDFSGTAHVDLDICSFDIDFGAGSPQLPSAISWSEFKENFLPEPSKRVDITVVKGLMAMANIVDSDPSDDVVAPDDWLISPKEFDFKLQSVMPIGEITFTPEDNSTDGILTASDHNAATNFGIAPMDLQNEDLNSTMIINVYELQSGDLRNDDFSLEPLLKKMPAAIWGEELSRNLNDDSNIEDALVGFHIVPANPPYSEFTKDIQEEVLQFDPEVFFDEADEFYWDALPAFTLADLGTTSSEEELNNTIDSNDERTQILKDLGLITDDEDEAELINILAATDDPDLNTFADQFLFTPQIEIS